MAKVLSTLGTDKDSEDGRLRICASSRSDFSWNDAERCSRGMRLGGAGAGAAASAASATGRGKSDCFWVSHLQEGEISLTQQKSNNYFRIFT